MLDPQVRRLLDAYPAIYLACHRRHAREDEHGNALTEQQAGILDHLHATRAVTPTRLAEHLGVSRSTISIALTRLVRGGYVRRLRSKQDARCIQLTLTSSGARVKEQNTILEPDLVRGMLHLMPPGEREATLQSIERLAQCANVLLKRRKRERDS